jgi:hypothetical protein
MGLDLSLAPWHGHDSSDVNFQLLAGKLWPLLDSRCLGPPGPAHGPIIGFGDVATRSTVLKAKGTSETGCPLFCPVDSRDLHRDRTKSGDSKSTTRDSGLLQRESGGKAPVFGLRVQVPSPKPPERRGFPEETGDCRIGRTAWLPWEDSNSHIRNHRRPFEMSTEFALKTAKSRLETFSI